MRGGQRVLRPYLLGFPVDAVPASPSLAKQVGTMELRDDVNAATGPADAAIARESAHATHEPGHATHTHVSRVSGQRLRLIIIIIIILWALELEGREWVMRWSFCFFLLFLVDANNAMFFVKPPPHEG